MHTLLSVQLAFESKQAGKNVVCRHIDDTEFQSLKDVSANCWFDPDYVFALQIDTITLGGYEFTKPYTLDELEAGMHIYYIGASGTILKGLFNPENEMLVSSVNNGSVQRDEENAAIQINAFRSLLGIESSEPTVVDYDFFVVDGESPKPETKKRGGGRKKKGSSDTTLSSNEEIIDSAETIEELNEIKATFNEANVELYGMIGKKEDSLNAQSAFSVPTKDEPQTEEDTTAIVQNYTAQLDQCMTEDDVMQVRYALSADNRLGREQVLQLNEHGEQRLAAIDGFVNAGTEQISTVSETGSKVEISIEASQQIKDEYMLSLTEAKLRSDIEHLKQLIDTDGRLIFSHKIHLNSYVEIRLRAVDRETAPVQDASQTKKDTVTAAETNIASLVQNLIDDMDAATTLDELQKVRDIMTHNMDSFNDSQVGDLQIHFEKRKEEINQIDWGKDGEDKVDADDCANTIRNATTLDKLKLVECSIRADLREEKIGKIFAGFLLKLIVEKRYELIAIQCDVLIQQVKVAKTADEANQPAAETAEWTDEQRVPLLAAISKRLVELDVSLLTQIRNAPSMAILNALVSEVKNLAPGTYPHQCMEAYTARKKHLTEPAT